MNLRLSREFDFDALREQANRERAEAVHRLLVRPVLRLLSDVFRPRGAQRATPRTEKAIA